MAEAQPWYEGIDLSRVREVLLPDGKWHSASRGSFRIGGGTFFFSVVTTHYSGPAASILAVREDEPGRGEPLRERSSASS